MPLSYPCGSRSRILKKREKTSPIPYYKRMLYIMSCRYKLFGIDFKTTAAPEAISTRMIEGVVLRMKGYVEIIRTCL